MVTGNGKLIVFSKLKFSNDHKQIVESDDPESSRRNIQLLDICVASNVNIRKSGNISWAQYEITKSLESNNSHMEVSPS
jgi:hypothetical protein